MAKQPKRKTRAEKVEEVAGGAVIDTPLSFTSPDSATILSASYDPDTETMIIAFKHGKSYVYNPIAAALWAEFEMAHSKGTFFAKRIRPIYAGRVKS